VQHNFLSSILCIIVAAGCSGPVATEVAVPEGQAAAVSFEQGTEQIQVLIDGRPFTTFHYEETWDKPFL
jgi:hypothetical protein